MTSGIIVVPNIGAIRPFTDFVAASVTFSAIIKFVGRVPEKSGQPFGVETRLELTANSIIELRDVDEKGNPIILQHAMNSKTKELVLNSATTLTALNVPTASPAEVFIPDDLSGGLDGTPATPPSEPTLTFGASPFFNDFILDPTSAAMKAQLITMVKNLNMFFGYEDEIQKLRSGPTTIGEDGQAAGVDPARLTELENVVARSRDGHDKRRKNILDFIERSYLVLTVDGFQVTRPTYTPKPADGKKPVAVEAIPADQYKPAPFREVIENFLTQHVAATANKQVPEVGRFIDDAVNALVDAIKVQ